MKTEQDWLDLDRLSGMWRILSSSKTSLSNVNWKNRRRRGDRRSMWIRMLIFSRARSQGWSSVFRKGNVNIRWWTIWWTISSRFSWSKKDLFVLYERLLLCAPLPCLWGICKFIFRGRSKTTIVGFWVCMRGRWRSGEWPMRGVIFRNLVLRRRMERMGGRVVRRSRLRWGSQGSQGQWWWRNRVRMKWSIDWLFL